MPRSTPESPHGCRRQSGVFSPRTQKDPGVESLTHMHPGQSFQTIRIISPPRRSNLVVVVPALLNRLRPRDIRDLIGERTAHWLSLYSQPQTRPPRDDPSQDLLVLRNDGPLL